MSDKVVKALQIFNNGFSCSQAVIGAFCEDYGIDEQTAMKFSAGFGGGFRCGEVCGAVSGAVMVIGLKYGQYLPNDSDSKAKCGEATKQYMKEYKNRNKSFICREILGYDPLNKEEATKFANEKRAKCSNAIEIAVSILEDMGY